MACAEAEHAVHVAEFGPLAPKRMETWPAARLMMADGNEERRDLARAARRAAPVLALDGGEPADAGRDEHADARRVSGVIVQPRVVHGELRRRNRELDEDVHLLDVFLLDERERIEALDLAGDPRRERVELWNRTG